MDGACASAARKKLVVRPTQCKKFTADARDIRSHNVLDERAHFLRDLAPLLLRLYPPLTHLSNVLVYFRDYLFCVPDKGRQNRFQAVHAFFSVFVSHGLLSFRQNAIHIQ